ncbi:MAG: 3'-5' exonuclease [Nitrospiraceae bacterium]|nr:MAG: 3'-5' exonuclease [Nitrospiraceae bacterium]
MRYIIIDVETTGLAPNRGDRVIEVGALMLVNNEVAEEFHSLIYIHEQIPFRVQLVHGISNEMLNGWPEADEVYPRLKRFVGKSTIVAHNAQFDMKFLRYEFSCLGLELNNPYKCTLQLSRKRLPHLPNHRLETVYCHVTGKNPEGRSHRALGDARMAAEIWKGLTSLKSS